MGILTEHVRVIQDMKDGIVQNANVHEVMILLLHIMVGMIHLHILEQHVIRHIKYAMNGKYYTLKVAKVMQVEILHYVITMMFEEKHIILQIFLPQLN